jgi:predicted RNA-binding protein YlqC (UPF0109 family)
MKDYLTFIIRELVDNPDEVSVDEIVSEQGRVLKLRVAREDLGKIIGRQGRMVRVLRTVLAAASIRGGERVLLDIEV